MESPRKKSSRAEQRAARQLAQERGIGYQTALQQLRTFKLATDGITWSEALQQLLGQTDADQTKATTSVAPVKPDEPGH